ncbi:hypothetical protein I6N90_12080 [Paenibacillus sp. GSMTC-2017]|uniref:hypothetical protein n=1 Tax=Paenibacillus sp. GSMTC-2017 TaxID=2794350 RepID=UPI0018D73514|nr:hypothetical protein [Paenibacillus sp. GSMTC-2017]MBH5318543.1 hypothetical protein [Paenibacillus sp. GSMTC-2017]
MTKHQESKKQSSYIFNLEILIEDEHHSIALERLIHELNKANFNDFRITSGIKLGQLIEERLADAPLQSPIPTSLAAATGTIDDSNFDGIEHVRSFMKNNTLIRLIVNRGLGIKLNIPCRIINIDEQASLITVYHVDEKQVYTFRLNEIEDFVS